LRVLDWFRKLRKATRKLVLPSREANSARSQNKLDLSKFSPPAVDSLARLAAHQEILIAMLSPCVSLAPIPEDGKRISEEIDRYRQQARELAAAVAGMGSDSADAIESQEATLAEFAAALAGADYYERLTAAFIGFGIIRDFFEELSDVYPKPAATAIRKALPKAEFWDWVAANLLAAMRADSRLANRLALWARSIVADCLLEVWRCLGHQGQAARFTPMRRNSTQFRELEPLVTALVSHHSSRMAKLELTA
jgi:hypothetical protein